MLQNFVFCVFIQVQPGRLLWLTTLLPRDDWLDDLSRPQTQGLFCFVFSLQPWQSALCFDAFQRLDLCLSFHILLAAYLFALFVLLWHVRNRCKLCLPLLLLELS